ncbi:MAG TPA: ribosome-associated translation inhibitor RaiA [Gammaproteobacteria bacterium]|nr:ribosome-associated translation inhibitor RaiA [Gammaproteobacteria bacterium]
MQLNITGNHMELTDAINDFVRDKFKKIERHSDQVTQVHVILSVEKAGHQAEATAHVTGNELFALATADDMYAAIDGLVQKIDRQILKHKEKTVARQNGAQSRAPNH